MKKGLMLLLAISASFALSAQLNSLPPSGGNQKSIVRQYLGAFAYVEIVYNSPDVSGREGQIWGQLVPYGKQNLGFGGSTADNPSPWRAGANENTTIEFSHDMQIQGKAIAAGKYGLHMVPAESGDWSVILTNENNAWGSYFYTPDDEVLTVAVTPQESPFREYLTYEFTERKVDQTTAELIWENMRIPFTVTMPDQNAAILAAVSSELKNAQGFTWTNWMQASNWASNAGYHNEAQVWAESAITAPFIGVKNFQTVSNKANVLLRAGNTEEAMKTIDEAIALPDATALQVHAVGRQLIAADMDDKALEVFQYNYKQNKKAWPTNYGLARGYSAKGDYKNALKYLKIALTQVPEGDTANPPVIEANIKKLENGEDIN